MCLEVLPCLLRCADEPVAISWIHILVWLEQTRCVGGQATQGPCGPGRRLGIVAGLRVPGGSCAVAVGSDGNAVQHGAVGQLHAEQPVQLPFDLVQDVRHTIAGFRDVPVVAEGRRIRLKSHHQVPERTEGERDVLVVVAGVMPAPGDIPGIALRRSRVQLGRQILSGSHVTGRMVPIPSIRLRDIQAASLIVECPHRGLQHIGIHGITHGERVRLPIIGRIVDNVLPRCIEVGEVPHQT
jgi:hypothetical protein